jgi:hypothetical protein
MGCLRLTRPWKPTLNALELNAGARLRCVESASAMIAFTVSVNFWSSWSAMSLTELSDKILRMSFWYVISSNLFFVNRWLSVLPKKTEKRLPRNHVRGAVPLNGTNVATESGSFSTIFLGWSVFSSRSISSSASMTGSMISRANDSWRSFCRMNAVPSASASFARPSSTLRTKFELMN